MRLPWYWNNRCLDLKDSGSCREKPKFRAGNEKGSGMVEAAIGFLFLLLLMLVSFEFLFVFTSYIALLNSTAQAAVYAAGHPYMDASANDIHYSHYVSAIQAEALSGGLSWKNLIVNLPELPPTVEAGEPLTVTLDYTLTTPFGEIFFPIFGKFGLPSEYQIRAQTSVPIRGGY